MRKEVMDAFAGGRHNSIPPIELAARYDRWEYGENYVAWTPDKKRGYVLREDAEGLFVLTVLIGEGREVAQRRRMYGKAKRI